MPGGAATQVLPVSHAVAATVVQAERPTARHAARAARGSPVNQVTHYGQDPSAERLLKAHLLIQRIAGMQPRGGKACEIY